MNKTVIIIPSRLDAVRLPNKPLELIKNKEMILHVYEAAQKRLQDQRAAVNCLNEQEREDLRKLYKKFRGVLSENMIVLRGSHDATENVIKIVIDAVKKERGLQANTAPAFKARPQGYKAYANA